MIKLKNNAREKWMVSYYRYEVDKKNVAIFDDLSDAVSYVVLVSKVGENPKLEHIYLEELEIEE